MDQCVVGISDTGVVPGEEVVVFGSGVDGAPTADDWARWSDTIGYEIVTRIGSRVPRVHVAAASIASPELQVGR
jgi:alanine racemase